MAASEPGHPSRADDSAPSVEPLPLWRRVLPFLLAALLVLWVLSRLDLQAFARALGRTHYAAYVGFTAPKSQWPLWWAVILTALVPPGVWVGGRGVRSVVRDRSH